MEWSEGEEWGNCNSIINKYINKTVKKNNNKNNKRSYTMIKWESSHGCKDGIIFAN